MIKTLGAGDLLATIAILAVAFELDVPGEMLFFISAYLIFKGYLFILDIGSIFDIMAGALLVLSIFLTPPFAVLILFAVLLGIKGFVSLIA